MNFYSAHRLFIVTFASLTAYAMIGCQATAPQLKDEDGRPLVSIACEHPRKRAGYGPPPYKYWRIIGGAVPKEGFALENSQDAPGPMSWIFVGPRPVTSEYWSGNADAGGRVASIACHPTNAAIVYIGTASGGIWKTTNSGTNWTPLTDAMPTLNSGAVRIDRNFPETVYAGTGEYVSGSQGDGLYRSLNGGATWAPIATVSNVGYDCSGLEIISGSNASMPAAIHLTGSSGYRRSTNGGVTWTSGGFFAGVSSLAVDRTNPQVVYIAKQSDGIYKSTNGGTSFTLLTGGLPTTGIRRIVLAMAPSASSTLYAAIVNTSGGLEGFYKTTDAGVTWTKLTSTPDFPKPQGSWDLSIGIDPTNANHLYCGGVSPVYQVAGVIESTDSGASWTEISASGGQIHPDQQCIAFDANNVPWFGCDGGIWRRSSGQWVNCNATLCAIQNYTISQHPNDPNRMMAGTQDNGANGTSTGSIAWEQIQAGDGGFGVYNAANFSTLYTTYVYLSIYRMVNTTQTNITGPWSGDTREWISPLVADANAANSLLGGTNRLWKNTAAMTTSNWTAISDTTVADGGTVTAISTVLGVANVIWVGNSKGGVWRTIDNGATWVRIRTNDNVRITTICSRPNSANEVFISRDAWTGARVLRTTNASTWTDVTGSLPSSIRGKTLAVDWGRSVPTMYLGAGAGIYASFTLGASWVKNGTDLPNVNIGQLEIDATRRTIIAGTYGRGAWRSSMPLPADIDADGQVGGADLSTLLAGWGTCSTGGLCPADINMSGSVDGADLTTLLSAWSVAP